MNKNIKKTDQIDQDLQQKSRVYRTTNAHNNHQVGQKNYKMTSNSTYFAALGGSSQIGQNLNVFSYNNNSIIVDIGVSFYKQHGIDVIMPSVEYLKGKKVTAIFITHTHQDHLGALKDLIRSFYPAIPVFVSRFCAEIIKQQAERKDALNIIYNWDYESTISIKPKKINVVVIEPGKEIKVGDFSVEFIKAAHSVPESHMLFIKTPTNSFINTGDWKIDETPLFSYKTDKARLCEIGKTHKVDAIFCDSTNACELGRTLSELDIKKNILEFLQKTKAQRFLFSTFSSNLERISSVIEGGQKIGFRVCVLGRSLRQYIESGIQMSYIEKNSIEFLDSYLALAQDKYKKNCIVICSGSQAEKNSILFNIAYSNRHIIQEDDVIVFSSRVIPGNESELVKMKSLLVQKGAILIDGKKKNLHTSGHATSEDIADLLKWVQPKCFIPMHGDFCLLQANAEIARSLDIKSILTGNGALVKIDGENTRVVGYVPAADMGKDGKQLVNMESALIGEREHLGCHGFVVVSVDLNNKLVEKMTKAVIEDNEKNHSLCENFWQVNLMEQLFVENTVSDPNLVSNIVKQVTKEFFHRSFKKDPVVIVNVFYGEKKLMTEETQKKRPHNAYKQAYNDLKKHS